MRRHFNLPHRQQGVALIASLIILLLMTVVAMSLMRGNSLFEKIAGNTREKQRALQSAQDALLYAEWWVTNASAAAVTPVASCSTTTAPTSMQVCPKTQDATTSLATINTYLPGFYSGYAPANMQVNTGGTIGGTVSSGTQANDIYYASKPGIWINALPKLGTSPLYRITAIGYGGGGANGAVAIVQSIYVVAGAGGPLNPTKGQNGYGG